MSGLRRSDNGNATPRTSIQARPDAMRQVSKGTGWGSKTIRSQAARNSAASPGKPSSRIPAANPKVVLIAAPAWMIVAFPAGSTITSTLSANSAICSPPDRCHRSRAARARRRSFVREYRDCARRGAAFSRSAALDITAPLARRFVSSGNGYANANLPTRLQRSVTPVRRRFIPTCRFSSAGRAHHS